MIRLVVTDLDGTFWDEDLAVPEPHRQTVAALRDRDVEVMVAGRDVAPAMQAHQ